MDPKIKQKTLRLLTNGLYVLTSRSGERVTASTVTWVSQVSFKPPLVIAAIRLDSAVLDCIVESRIAALHVLDRSEKAIAQKFFSHTKHTGNTVNGEPYIDGVTSAPVLRNLSAWLECKVVDVHQRQGDHALVLFEVVDAQLRRPVKPLIVADSPWQYGG
jgi:flavin reductase (DIM6/NTAB) family NADH-FMN oxidoreductase RutF